MRFGMPTLLELDTLDECAALCRDLGLDFVEFNMDLPAYQIERLDAHHLSDIAERFGVSFTIHLEDTAYAWNFNNGLSRAYTDTVLRTIELAARLSIPTLNMHFHQGEYFTLPDKKVYLFDRYRDEFLHKVTAFRDACDGAAWGSGVSVCVENTSSFLLDFVAEGFAALLESPVFALTLDTGHNASSGFRQQHLIDRHIERLRHMHLHDHSATRGDHLPLGEGEQILPQWIDLALRHGCSVVLETKTVAGLRSSVEWLRRNGYLLSRP